MVASIFTYSLSAPISCTNTRNTFSHTPSSAHQLWRRCTFFQSPKRTGRSHQGMPARYRYNTASQRADYLEPSPPRSPADQEVKAPAVPTDRPVTHTFFSSSLSLILLPYAKE